MDIENKYANIVYNATVNIKRTDGRIHGAFIQHVNHDTEMVSVEWIEGGETRGKEIDFDSLLSLNPNLIPTRQSQIIPRSTRRQEIPKPRISTIPTSQPISSSLRSMKNGKVASRSTLVSSKVIDNDGVENVPPPSSSLVTRSRASQNVNNNISKINNINPPTIQNVKGRRSNVVKEVEKLKKNREERRLRQAEEKAEKDAFLNQAPGNPYWEFLNMVREYQKTLDYRYI